MDMTSHIGARGGHKDSKEDNRRGSGGGRKLTFHQKVHLAKSTYGIASIRPQDENSALLRQQRRVNTEVLLDFPNNYEIDLRNWNLSQIKPKTTELQSFTMEMVTWIKEPTTLAKASNQIENFTIVAVDFEFHQEESFSGFIAVASVSTPTETFVIDCIDETLDAPAMLTPILQSTSKLKVFCGADNDISHLQKWGCFCHAVVDVQDMFAVWNKTQFEKCYHICRSALVNRLKSKGKEATDYKLRAYLRDLIKPGLAFLSEVFPAIEPNTSKKDEITTFADWRVRKHGNLHPDLLKYAALDSFETLRLFYALKTEIGGQGIREAVAKGVPKLVNKAKLPKHMVPEVTASISYVNLDGHDRVCKQVKEWIIYMGKLFDCPPLKVVKDVGVMKLLVDQIIEMIQDNKLDADVLGELLSDANFFGFNVNSSIAGRLLYSYVNPDDTDLLSWKSKICRKCNNEGHIALLCPFEFCSKAKQAYEKNEGNKDKRREQQLRRATKFAEKIGSTPQEVLNQWYNRGTK